VEIDAPLIAERHGKRVNWSVSADLVAGGAYLYENYWRRDETWPSSSLESLDPSTGTFSQQQAARVHQHQVATETDPRAEAAAINVGSIPLTSMSTPHSLRS
jgi:hypothetical protein